MTARERLELMIRTDRTSMTVWSPAEVRAALDEFTAEVRADERAKALADAAASLEAVPGSGDGNDWNWWDAATIPASCAALLRRIAAQPTQEQP